MRYLATVCLALICLQACTGQQMYNSAQGARQNECRKILDNAARDRCFETADKQYDQYSKEVQEIK
ncbi:MAG: hypothetical protein ACXWT7_08590 [Methylophilaceae bacterium]